MDAEQALELVKQGSTLLLLDVPQHTLIGIDTQIFFAGPVFMGIKMIPPGVHFIYYSSSSREGKDFSPIIGFFVETSPSEVVIRRWNPLEERLVKVAEEEEERYSRAVKNMEFDRQLGPYTLMEYRNWRQLSSFLTKDIIEKIEPIGGEITVACESRLVDDFPKSAIERSLHEQSMTSKFRRSDVKSVQKGCYFTPIPRIVKHKGISGQELTSLNLDKTHLLERLLAAECGGNEDRLLGELQFAFVAFLMGQSLEAFLQWKSLVSLLLGCSEAPFRTRTQFFTKFIRAIYYQLRHGFQKEHKGSSGMESTPLLDDSWFSDDNFLYRLCKDFFSLVDETPVVDGDLLTWTRKLKELLENTLGWSFQNRTYADGLPYEEDDEFAPVVEIVDESYLH